MTLVNFDQLFDGAFHLANHTTLTVTQAPEHEEELLGMLEHALTRGLRNRAQLTEIHVPLERYPTIDSKFWHIPVEDSGESKVLRFFFEAAQLTGKSA
jgi:hypothetical protein